MGDREYRSIGETLELIKEEFPEVTISKIRFLETQGLIAPERTTNGYRKFYDHDIEKLAFVLRQQREQFLPLKVIKDRITEKEPGVFVLDPSKGRFAKNQKGRTSKFEKDIFGDPLDEPRPSHQLHNSKPKVEGKAATSQDLNSSHYVVKARGSGHAAASPESRTDHKLTRSGRSSDQSASDGHSPTTQPAIVGTADVKTPIVQDGSQSVRTASGKRPRLFALPSTSALAENLDVPRALNDVSEGVFTGLEQDTEVGETGFPKNSFTAREIAEQADLSLVQVEDLTTYGLLNPTSIRGQQIFCIADLELATLAKEFARFGLEARHLKMYKVSAEREASFLEQVILPILANKSQKSRNRAEAALTQLGEIGAQFRTLLLERAIEKILNS